jgi:hypothetical protein
MAGSGNWGNTALGSLTTNYSADSRDTLRIITNDGSANDRATLAVTAVKGARYRIQYDYKAVQGNKGRVTWSGYDSGNQQLTSSSFATVTSEFTATTSGSTEITIYPSRADGPTGGSANDELLIDNLTLVRIGAVAEYDGSGIASDKWFDKSGNDLHGTVSGSTVENAPSSDDGLVYEEGTFTVTSSVSGGGTVTVNTSYDTLKYVRIGNTVHITGCILFSTVTGTTEYVALAGFPFDVGTGDELSEYATLNVNTLDNGTAKSNPAFAFATSGTSFHIRLSGETGDGKDWIDNIDTGTSVLINGAYMIND